MIHASEKPESLESVCPSIMLWGYNCTRLFCCTFPLQLNSSDGSFAYSGHQSRRHVLSAFRHLLWQKIITSYVMYFTKSLKVQTIGCFKKHKYLRYVNFQPIRSGGPNIRVTLMLLTTSLNWLPQLLSFHALVKTEISFLRQFLPLTDSDWRSLLSSGEEGSIWISSILC